MYSSRELKELLRLSTVWCREWELLSMMESHWPSSFLPPVQSHLRDPPPEDPAVAAESVRGRGDGPKAAGANQEGAAGGAAPPHADGEALPRAGGHHCQRQAAASPAARGGGWREEPAACLSVSAGLGRLSHPAVCLTGLQVAEGDGDDTDLQIFCVSCSHPVNPKVALRHMERCYAKVGLPRCEETADSNSVTKTVSD